MGKFTLATVCGILFFVSCAGDWVHASISEVQQAAFSPNGEYFAWTVVQSDGAIKEHTGLLTPTGTTLYWLTEPWTGKPRQLELTTKLIDTEWPQASIAQFTFSPDSKWIAILFRDELECISLETGMVRSIRHCEDVAGQPVWISPGEIAFSQSKYRSSDMNYMYRINHIKIGSKDEAPKLVTEILTSALVDRAVSAPLEYWSPDGHKVILGPMYFGEKLRVVDIQTGKVNAFGTMEPVSAMASWTASSKQAFCITLDSFEGRMRAWLVTSAGDTPKDVTGEVTALEARASKDYPSSEAYLDVAPIWVQRDSCVLFQSLFYAWNPASGVLCDIRSKLKENHEHLIGRLDQILALSADGWYLVVAKSGSTSKKTRKVEAYVTTEPFAQLRRVPELDRTVVIASRLGRAVHCVSPNGRWCPDFNLDDCTMRMVELTPRLIPLRAANGVNTVKLKTKN